MDDNAVLGQLIENYINGSATAEKTVLLALGKIDIDKLESSHNELHIHCFQAIKFLVCENNTTYKEMEYLLKCLKGELNFSKEGLINAIFNSNVRRIFYAANGLRKSRR